MRKIARWLRKVIRDKTGSLMISLWMKCLVSLVIFYILLMNALSFSQVVGLETTALALAHLLSLGIVLYVVDHQGRKRRIFEQVMDHLREAVFLIDSSGRIRLINNYGKRDLHLFEGDPIPEPLVPQKFREELVERIKSDEDGPFLHYKSTYQGRTFSVRIQSGGGGPFTNLAGSVLDITESEKSRYYTEKYHKQSALAFLGSIFESLAHEIRTPCLASEACFKMIIDEIIAEGEPTSLLHHQSILRLCQNGMRTTSQIGDLLNKSRSFRHAYRKSEMGDIDLEEACLFCKETIEAAYNSIISGHIHLEARQPGPYMVKGYLNRFLEALGNILRNSVEAIMESSRKDPEKSPYIHITLRRECMLSRPDITEIFTLEIIDNGGGFDQSIQERIGTAFFSTKNQPDIKGTGLGLTLAIQTINAMAGTWEIDNIYDSGEIKGSRTMVKFPVPQNPITITLTQNQPVGSDGPSSSLSPSD